MNFNTTSILMVAIIALVAISPVMAFLDEETTTVAGNAVGDHSDGNTQIAWAATANDGGVIDLSTDNSNKYIDATTRNVYEAVKLPANYYGFDTPTVETTFMTIYEGQVIVAPNNKDIKVFSKAGDTWRYTVRSSVPVLAYVINAMDTDKAKWDSNCAPKYDEYMEKFTVGNLNKIYMSKFRSPVQQFEVKVPADGDYARYALVIDTRVAHYKNGIFQTIVDDSADIIYTIEKVKDGAPEDSADYEGPSMAAHQPLNMYPILSNGMADTTGSI